MTLTWDIERGPRQRVVACLGDAAEASRLGVEQAAVQRDGSSQSRLFDDDPQPEWVEVDSNRVKVEGGRDLGGCWLGPEQADDTVLGSQETALLRTSPKARQMLERTTVVVDCANGEDGQPRLIVYPEDDSHSPGPEGF